VKKLILAAALTALLSGCAATYTFDGQRYSSKEEFLSSVDRTFAQAVENVQPLPRPVSTKTLVFAFPSLKVTQRQSVVNFEKVNGRMIGLGEQIMIDNITVANVKSNRVYFDAIKKRNIYAGVKFVELDSMTADLQASSTEDVLFYSEPRQGAGQFYFVNAKAGKQAFAFDRGASAIDARLTAFLQAVQLQAVRD
jgi:hypothetical protein